MNKEVLTLLIFGDIFGKMGRNAVKENIDALKNKYHPDLTIANVENMTHGSGFSAVTINEMMDAGVDFCTGGDHSLDNAHGVKVLKMEDIPVIRPYNLGEKAPGKGFRVVEKKGIKILIINLLGRLFMKRKYMNDDYANPFTAIDEILKTEEAKNASAIIVDFHAETTSEKISFAHSVDGKVSLVYGTHTHVQTADERILKNGTGFITDVGFNGPLDSVIGMQIESAVHNFKHPSAKKVSIAESGARNLNAIIVQIDTKTGRCIEIKRINKVIN